MDSDSSIFILVQPSSSFHLKISLPRSRKLKKVIYFFSVSPFVDELDCIELRITHAAFVY